MTSGWRERRPLDVLVLTGGHSADLGALLGTAAAICDERGWRWGMPRRRRPVDGPG